MPANSKGTKALVLYTSTGDSVPSMERSEALTKELIPSKLHKGTKPLYDLELTLPFLLSIEKSMLIHACDNLAQGNRKYLVVYDRTSAQIYTSTSTHETAHFAYEERNDITQLFSQHALETNGLSIQSEEELTKLAE